MDNNMNNAVYCIYCGSENDKDSKFCISCGKAIVSEEEQSMPETETAFSQAVATPFASETEEVKVSDSAPAFEEAGDNASQVFSEIKEEKDTSVLNTTIVRPFKDLSNTPDTAVAFGEAKEDSTTLRPESVIEEKKIIDQYNDDEFAFATGLPEWSLEPPQVMVRRHRS